MNHSHTREGIQQARVESQSLATFGATAGTTLGEPVEAYAVRDARDVAPRVVTYVRNATVPLTKACVVRCQYCGYYKDGAPLLAPDEVRRLLDAAQRNGATEILVTSGDLPERFPHILRQLKELGYASYLDYVLDVCSWCLDRDLVPHTNIGYVAYDEMERLREVNGSMGIMLENIDAAVVDRLQPKKTVAGRLEVIASAGKLRIPFTSGILMGLGEERDSRRATLEAILRLHDRYGHVQEVILQNFVVNSRSALRAAQRVTLSEYEDLIAFVREHSDIEVQIPPNLMDDYPTLIERGASDLGGISADIDYINFENPWNETAMVGRLRSAGAGVRLRLTVYAKYYRMGWCAPRVAHVVERYSRDDAYRYYFEPGGERVEAE